MSDSVADIVDEMRKRAHRRAANARYEGKELEQLCDRLQAAADVTAQRGSIAAFKVFKKQLIKLLDKELALYERRCRRFNNGTN